MTMANRSHNPNTQCLECGLPGGLTIFEGETFTVKHKGTTIDVANLAGTRCSDCGDVIFEDASAQAYAAAGDGLVLQARKATAATLKRQRENLKLTQQAAALLTGGGHNAFNRYESGSVAPLPAVVNLFTLLDRHPELLSEIQPPQEKQREPNHAVA